MVSMRSYDDFKSMLIDDDDRREWQRFDAHSSPTRAHATELLLSIVAHCCMRCPWRVVKSIATA